MKKVLESKGFVWNDIYEQFEGEFNGSDVIVSIVTNNNKVYRIFVADKYLSDEIDIKIRFNTLCQQFRNNGKYFDYGVDQTIPENENIDYEMSVNSKRYKASFYQMPQELDTLKVQQRMFELAPEYFTEEEFQNIDNTILEMMIANMENADIQEPAQIKLYSFLLKIIQELIQNNSVWFMIDEQWGGYRILMYYDNLLNQANGEDL